ncbi:PP2C family protein-serine/threonine phosphatase [Corynebacterium aquilae]|uniref:Protein phosphatase n=1 Tax=Corynebacterium aquilae DSM 44791 TaxID=1431546 RepID=A0A1L7CD98_9CORY|nr:protein phosphatase 2C domain-containing protein [Corynebacterium aquilae]APT83763.1 protein phosphatase [Corynebacterium aquilae DSM 44791]
MLLNYAVASDRGLVRGNNEDSAYAGPHLLALADGMGGHAAGEVASQIMISHMRRLDVAAEDMDMLAVLGMVADEGNRAIAAQVRAHPDTDGMGTTLTALMFDGEQFGLCHVGDSRGYRLRDGALEQITVDDTYVQSLVDAGDLDPEDISTHPQRSLILKAYTGRPVEPTLRSVDAQVGDRLLLCSDGLSDPVTASTIETTLLEGTPEQAARRLVELALRSGGPDNVTVVVADVIAGDDEKAAEVPTVPVTGGALNAGDPEDPRPDTAAGRAAMMAARTPKTVPADDAPVVPSATADGDRPTTTGGEPKKSRKGLIGAISVVVILGLVGAGLFFGVKKSEDHYFLATDSDDNIVIEQGSDYTIFGRSLHHTALATCLNEADEVKTVKLEDSGSLPADCSPFKLSDLPPAARGSVDSIPGGTLPEMVQRLTTLAGKALPVCVTREPADASAAASSSAAPTSAAASSAANQPQAAPSTSSASAAAAPSTAVDDGDMATPGVNCRQVRS